MDTLKSIELVEKTTLQEWVDFVENQNTSNDILQEIDTIIKDNPAEYLKLAEKRTAIYETRQTAYKLIGNSIYGYTGATNTRFYTLDIAESVTMQGVEMIKLSQNLIENILGLKILYGDTDSIFISVEDKIPENLKNSPDADIINWIRNVYVKNEIDAKLKPVLDELAISLGCNGKHYFAFKQEIIAKRGLFLKSKDTKKEFAKKRYLLWIVDKEGVPKDELFLRGVEIRRNELPAYIRDFLKTWVTDILKGTVPISEIIEKSHSFKEVMIDSINKGEIEKFSKNIGLTKDFNEYKTFTYSTKGALLWNSLLYNIFGLGKISLGAKMRIIFLKEKTYYNNIYTKTEIDNISADITNVDLKLIRSKAMTFHKMCNGKLSENACLILSGMKYFDLNSISIPSEIKKLPTEVAELYDIDVTQTLNKIYYEQIDTYLAMIGKNVSNVKYGSDEMDDII